MKDKALNVARRLVRKLSFEIIPAENPVTHFHSDNYLRHTARRLEHLSGLRISVAGMTVLEVGAGIGDHSHYYMDRGCKITITEARSDNLQYLKKRYPQHKIEHLDMEHPSPVTNSPFDIVHCYGLLYHLKSPQQALQFLSSQCQRILFLETCVSFGEVKEINLVSEDQDSPTQAFSGSGCRPTRAWVFEELKRLFEYVYLPTTQPNHEEFPLDWTLPKESHKGLSRAIYIASRQEIDSEMLTLLLVNHQTRHQ